MGTDYSTPAEVAGQANTNVIVEQGMQKVDVFHSILLLVLLVLVAIQTAYLGLRHYQKSLKKKYLERQLAGRIAV